MKPFSMARRTSSRAPRRVTGATSSGRVRVRVTSAGSADVGWAGVPSGREVGGVEGAADVPETAGSRPAGGSKDVVKLSIIVC